VRPPLTPLRAKIADIVAAAVGVGAKWCIKS